MILDARGKEITTYRLGFVPAVSRRPDKDADLVDLVSRTYSDAPREDESESDQK